MRYHVTIGDRTVQVDLGPEGVRVDGTPVETDLATLPGTSTRSLLLDGASHQVVARRRPGGEAWTLHLPGRVVEAHVVDERTRRIREMTGGDGPAEGPGTLLAPMPGLVVKVEVGEGDAVEAGQGLVIVEAMKMENELRADGPATVRAVRVQVGDAVEKGQVLIEFTAGAEAAEG